MKPAETISVTKTKLHCDGDAASGHPRVFLMIDGKGYVDCPYCGRHFVLDKNAHAADAH